MSLENTFEFCLDHSLFSSTYSFYLCYLVILYWCEQEKSLQYSISFDKRLQVFRLGYQVVSF